MLINLTKERAHKSSPRANNADNSFFALHQTKFYHKTNKETPETFRRTFHSFSNQEKK